MPPALRSPGPWQLCGAFGTGATNFIKVSRDGTRAVAVTDSGQAWVIDTQTFQLLGVFTHGAPVSFAGLSPDGQILATVDDTGGRVALWAVNSHTLLRVISRAPGQPSYYGLGQATFSNDGRLLAVISYAHLDVYVVSTGQPLPISGRTDLGGGMSVGFAASDTRLVIARFLYIGNPPYARTGTIVLVDTTTGDNLAPVTLPLPANLLATFAISGDGRTVAVGGYDPQAAFIRLVDPVTGSLIREMTIVSVPLALNQDASLIAVADLPDVDGELPVTVRNIDGGAIYSVNLPPGAPSRARPFAVTNDLGTLLAGGGAPQVVVSVDFASGETEGVACGTGHFSEISAVGVTPNATTLVTSGQSFYPDPTFVWDVVTGQQLNVPPPNNLITPSAISPDGRLRAALANDGPNFNLVDIASGTIVNTLGPAATRPESFDFSPSGALIVSDSARDPVDRRLNPVANLWNVGAGTLIQQLPHLTSIAFPDPRPVLFSPDQASIFVGGYGTTARWCR